MVLTLHHKHYAVNGTTLFSILGLCAAPAVGFISLVNSAGGILSSVMYLVNGGSTILAGSMFFVATAFFIVAVLSKKSFSYFYSKLQQQQLPR